MKKIIFKALFVLFSINMAVAQDTVVVQTLDFNDITKRKGWYIFPQDTSYQKVLMYYTLKCDAATTQDGYACGEWDYTTFTNLYQHNNVGVSKYIVDGGNSPDTISYTSTPTYTYYNQNQYYIVYDNVISENDYSIGSGNNNQAHPFSSSSKVTRAQYIWTAAELIAAGIGAGPIDRLKFDVNSLGSSLNDLTVKMGHTTVVTPTNFQNNNLIETYHFNTSFTAVGIDSLNFTTPFIWDGISNVLVELSFSNATTGNDNLVKGEITSGNSGIYSSTPNSYLNFENNQGYVEVTNYKGISGNNSRTIEAWINISSLSTNDEIVSWGTNSTGEKWIFRINGTGVLRAEVNGGYILGSTAVNDGNWHHVACVFSGTNITNTLFYVDGQLETTGGSVSQSVNTNTSNGVNVKISKGINNKAFNGDVDEVRIWDAALSQTDIQNWMYQSINAGHTNYANLQLYFPFNTDSGFIAYDQSIHGRNGSINGGVWLRNSGDDLFLNFQTTNERPNIILTQGNYSSHLDSVLVIDSVMNPPISIIQYGTSINTVNTGITLTAIDTTIGWNYGWVYTYDQYGNKVDSTFINYDNQFVNSYNQITFQIQNYVTPYGIGLSLGNNGFRWVYDVTDYQRLLHDTVEISAGNQQELIDLKFIMIKGTPPRDVLKVESIWNGNYQHSAIANDLVMPAVDIDLDPAASSFRIKTRTSGHWFGGFQNCAEFCPKDHNVFVDGVKRFEWSNWKLCAGNPVIAQGGTWIYDRAGWCPGTFTDTYDHELTPFVTPGITVSLDYGMETTTGGMEGNYRTTMQLVTYGANNFVLDARIDEIISPNDWEYHNRVNPICADPKIVIQNTGTTTLTSLTITYNVKGGATDTYTWTGNLAFMEKEEVMLPVSNQAFWTTAATQDIFEVSVSAPNGGTDGYAANNSAACSFEKPEVYSGLFYLETKTNNAGYENSYTIKDSQGAVVMSRGAMASNTTYRDTINLPDGCYVLDFLDSDEDGMSFFANSDGNGSLKLQWIPPTTPWTKNFNAKFGSFIKHYFVIDNTVGVDSYNKLQQIEVFPNPSHDVFNLNITGLENETVNVGIYNAMGEVLHSKSVTSVNGSIKTTFDLSDTPNGIYFIRVFGSDYYSVKRIVKN